MGNTHIKTGSRGEQAAAKWLEENGFVILHRNWRSGRYELDIVAERNGRLHFIEVKTRRSLRYGLPETAVNAVKFKHIQSAAAHYVQLNPTPMRFQFDILSIVLVNNEPPQFWLAEDVFL